MSIWWPLQDGEVHFEAGRPAEHWVLQMIAEYSSVQLSIATAIAAHLRRKSPALGRKLAQRHLNRLSDDDRWDYLNALATDAGYTGELLSSASAVFQRCKKVRDLVGHHPDGMELVRSKEQPTPHYYLSRNDKSKGIPDPLTPLTFRQLGAECRWLIALIDRIAYLAGQTYVSAAVDVDEQGQAHYRYMEVLEPPGLPVPPDWTAEGLSRPLRQRPGSDVPVEQQSPTDPA